MCDSRVWAAQLSALGEFSPWSPDGYGDATTITAMAERVLADTSPRISLCGHSMGARVSLEVLRLAPERIERLALLDTGVHPQRPGEREKRVALLEIGKSQGIEALVDAWLPPMVHPSRRTDMAFLAPMRTMCLEAGLPTYERQMEALLSRPDGAAALALVRVPTLVGVGRQDEWSPISQHEEIAAQLPDARLTIFEDSGHMAPVEAADQVNRALRQWLTA
jgi:pimeloyl-ACP methyl ester carboxylesterase